MAETYDDIQTANPPEWVEEAGPEAVWAWKASLAWRCDAASARSEYYQKFLIAQAKNAYYAK